jgi:hypothetical protein
MCVSLVFPVGSDYADSVELDRRRGKGLHPVSPAYPGRQSATPPDWHPEALSNDVRLSAEAPRLEPGPAHQVDEADRPASKHETDRAHPVDSSLFDILFSVCVRHVAFSIPIPIPKRAWTTLKETPQQDTPYQAHKTKRMDAAWGCCDRSALGTFRPR